ncbi:MAG TPA: hypothetical protein VFA18_07370 [Gemmataceae bacterium]|nr:hypothetical protein [Gemmataceae bacterium]
MAHSKSKSPFIGLWHIVAMDAWHQDYLNEEVQADVEFENNGAGHFRHERNGRSGLGEAEKTAGCKE